MGETWSCGIRALPATIEGDPPKPVVAVLWTCQAGVRAAGVFEGTEVGDAELAGSFEQAVVEPMVGVPGRRPSRIRVASEPLARRIGALVSGPDIEVAPTPDVEHAFDSLAAAMSAPPGDQDDVLAALDLLGTLDEPLRHELMLQARDFFEAQPWTLFAADVPVKVRIPAHELRDGHLTIMGHGGETYGLMLFRTGEDFTVFCKLSEAHGPVAPGGVPTCYSLTYERVPPEAMGLGPGEGELAVPSLTVFERDVQRQPSRSEVELLLAATAGMNRFMDVRWRELTSRRTGDAAVRGRYRIAVLGRTVEVRLTAP